MELTDAEVIEWMEQHCYQINAVANVVICMMFSCEEGVGLGFNLRNIVAALEILRKITPEGYRYVEHEDAKTWPSGQRMDRRVIFEKLPEPVEYEYVAEANERKPRIGDWIRSASGRWHEVTCLENILMHEQLCYRRVEVKHG